MTEKLLIAVDESPASINAVKWASRNLVKQDMELHLITVLPPIVHTVYPVAPFATAAAVSAVTQHWDAQKSHDEVVAKDILQNALNIVTSEGKIDRHSVVPLALPAAGGASGVGDSIVEYAKSKNIDLVVVGSRGLGAVKRSLMSLIGLGSVSDYCVHNMHCPVIVTRYDGKSHPSKENEDPQQPRKFCVACDDSAHAEAALTWAVKHMRPVDQLHLLTVALPVPYPEIQSGAVALATAIPEQSRAERNALLAEKAWGVVRRALLAAAHGGVAKERIVYKVLGPEGGASDVGASISHYAEHNNIDLVVLGSRGLGSFQRSVMSIIGLGSVSDYCVHNLKVPVAVVKSLEAAAAPGAATAAATTKIGTWQAPVPMEPMAQASVGDKTE